MSYMKVPWMVKIRNVGVLGKAGVKKSLLSAVKTHKLVYFGVVKQSSSYSPVKSLVRMVTKYT